MQRCIAITALCAAVGVFSSAIPRSAHAQDATEAIKRDNARRADVLFDRAKGLIDEDKYDRACPMLEEAQRLDPTMVTQFRLAECFEKSGEIAKAHHHFLQVAEAAKKAGQPEREDLAKQRAAALVPSLGRLVVRMRLGAEVPPNLRITLDHDTEIQPKVWGNESVLVERGEHLIMVTAPGKMPVQRKVMVKEAGKTVVLAVPELADEVADTSSTPPEQASTWTTGRYVSVGWGGLSIAMLIAGTVVLTSGGDKVDDGQRSTSSALFGAGCTGLMGSSLLWYFSGPPNQSPARVGIGLTPVLGPSQAGASLVGRF